MNADIIDFKSFEYIGRVGTTSALGDLQKAKKDITTLLWLCRLKSRLASQQLVEKEAATRALHRSIKKAEAEGVVFPFGEQRLAELRKECEAAEKKLARIGELISLVLDMWQDAGATLVGAGIAVEKAFQPGGDLIRGMGVRVESLARIKSMSVENGVEFC